MPAVHTKGTTLHMPNNEILRIAKAGGEALVESMPTESWPWTRERALTLFRSTDPARADVFESWLDESAQDVRSARPDEQAELRRELVSLWRRRLDRMLTERPAAEGELRGLIERIRAVLPADRRAGAKKMTAIARDQGTVYAVMDGNIHQHAAPPRHRQADESVDPPKGEGEGEPK